MRVTCSVIAGTAILTGCNLASLTPQKSVVVHRARGGYPLIPNQKGQEFASKIELGNVVKLCFYGPNFAGYESDKPLEITDPRMIKRFLTALREEESCEVAIGNMVDNMDVVLKEAINEEGNILEYNFCGWSAEMSRG